MYYGYCLSVEGPFPYDLELKSLRFLFLHLRFSIFLFGILVILLSLLETSFCLGHYHCEETVLMSYH